jgi:mRNA-degrading endonuclease RelE of RelBE toxin-antitoxin system
VTIRFHKGAKSDFDTAIIYYEEQQRELGTRFRNSVQQCIDMIVQFPHLYPVFINDVRKCVLRKFPYSVLYSIDKDTLVVYAIASHYRKSSEVETRIEDSNNA